MISRLKKILFVIVLFTIPLLASNLTNALRYVDNGDIVKAKQILAEMMKKSPNSPDALLLDAILTTDASKALEKFRYIYDNYPKFKYADLCLFRIYSYNYAIGNYKTAERYIARLRGEFPDSPYANAVGELPKVHKTLLAKKFLRKTGEFTIQVGAFSDFSNAKNLANKLKQNGFDSHINKKIVKGSIFNVVTVGFFNNKKEAVSTMQKLKKEFSLSSQIFKIPE